MGNKGNIFIGKRGINDDKDFQNLFMDFYAPLISFANRFVPNRSHAEDIVQEVFVNLWENREELSDISNISSYLYVSVRNKSFNHIRDNKKVVETGELINTLEDKNIEDLIVEEESVRIILSELESLPSRCKDIFTLSLHGLKSRDIAEELGVAIETVKKQKQRAKRLLKAKVSELLSIFLLFQ